MANKKHLPADAVDGVFTKVAEILETAQKRVVRQVNSEMVLAYWLIGREIVLALQDGKERANYGSELITRLADLLTQRYGRGYSVTNIKYFRLFYQAYANRQPQIRHEPRDELPAPDQAVILEDLQQALAEHDSLQGFSPRLSWTHYRTLSRVEERAERLFYEIEAERNGWSQPELERQIHSHLYLRLLKSRDKAGVMALASEGQRVEQPLDVIKHPYVLDFLALPEAGQWHESDLESAIINQLQPFLLELGKGFAFVARQQRVTTEHQHFYIDLVFYNYLLKCFVLVDLKLGKLTHQDVGQMDMYVRMYDDLKRNEGDNPTVGLILCTDPDSRLASKGGGMAFLSYTTHALAENRHGLIVDVHTTPATGTAEREAALVMLKRSVKPARGGRKPTVAADRGYDTAEFVSALAALGIAPHVAAKTKSSAVPEHIKATEGYRVSLRRRKMIEEAFGWVKDIGTLRRLMARGLDKIRAHALLNFAAYNLTRLGNLLAP